MKKRMAVLSVSCMLALLAGEGVQAVTPGTYVSGDAYGFTQLGDVEAVFDEDGLTEIKVYIDVAAYDQIQGAEDPREELRTVIAEYLHSALTNQSLNRKVATGNADLDYFVMDFEANLGECMEQAGMARYQPDEELSLDEDGDWNSDRFVTLSAAALYAYLDWPEEFTVREARIGWESYDQADEVELEFGYSRRQPDGSTQWTEGWAYTYLVRKQEASDYQMLLRHSSMPEVAYLTIFASQYRDTCFEPWSGRYSVSEDLARMMIEEEECVIYYPEQVCRWEDH